MSEGKRERGRERKRESRVVINRQNTFFRTYKVYDYHKFNPKIVLVTRIVWQFNRFSLKGRKMMFYNVSPSVIHIFRIKKYVYHEDMNLWKNKCIPEAKIN